MFLYKHMTAIGGKNSNSHVHARIELCLTLTIAHPLNLEFRLSKYQLHTVTQFLFIKVIESILFSNKYLLRPSE